MKVMHMAEYTEQNSGVVELVVGVSRLGSECRVSASYGELEITL